MKIERISPQLAFKMILHFKAGGKEEIKFESKDKNAYYSEFLTYVENYCTKNGFTVFAVDQENYYIKKE